MKNDMAKRAERAKVQESKYREMPDIVVRVVCKYRAELYFKISRKTKLARLFNAWTDRMETTGGQAPSGKLNGSNKSEAASTSSSSPASRTTTPCANPSPVATARKTACSQETRRKR